MKSGCCGRTIDEEDADDSGFLQYLPPYSLGAHKTWLLEVPMNGDKNHKPWDKMGLDRGEPWLNNTANVLPPRSGRQQRRDDCQVRRLQAQQVHGSGIGLGLG